MILVYATVFACNPRARIIKLLTWFFHFLWRWHCLEADDCVNIFKPWKCAVLGRRFIGRCCLAVICLITGEAIQVNSHLCASGSRGIVHTWVRRNRGISTTAHHTIERLVVRKWALNGCSRCIRVHCWNTVHDWSVRKHYIKKWHRMYI